MATSPRIRSFRSFTGATFGCALRGPGGAENVFHRVIPLVARVLVHQRALRHIDSSRPRPGPGRWIVDRELVLERVRVDPVEPLDHAEVLCSTKRGELRR